MGAALFLSLRANSIGTSIEMFGLEHGWSNESRDVFNGCDCDRETAVEGAEAPTSSSQIFAGEALTSAHLEEMPWPNQARPLTMRR